MSRFDVYASPNGFGMLLDCQADLLSGLSTRFMVPLVPVDDSLIASLDLEQRKTMNALDMLLTGY